MSYKTCSTCNEVKCISDFYEHRNKCKSCFILNKKEKYSSEKRKKYYENNKNKFINYQNDFYIKNKELINEQKKIYYINNKNKIKKNKQDYYYKNIDKIKEYKKNRIKFRFKNDMSFKIKNLISRQIHYALKGKKNNMTILKFLPYTIQELKIHLQSQFKPWMTWLNWGMYKKSSWNDNDSSTWKWNIDHIIPQSKLPYISMEDDNFKKCWSLDNLRPLSSKENLIKRNKLVV